MSKVHILSDDISTLYIRKGGGKWCIIWRDRKAQEWRIIGRHDRLEDAKADARALMA